MNDCRAPRKELKPTLFPPSAPPSLPPSLPHLSHAHGYQRCPQRGRGKYAGGISHVHALGGREGGRGRREGRVGVRDTRPASLLLPPSLSPSLPTYRQSGKAGDDRGGARDSPKGEHRSVGSLACREGGKEGVRQ